MKRPSGLKLLEEREGEGRQAGKGDRAVYNPRIFLSQGEAVPFNDIQAKQIPKEMIRAINGVTFIDHTFMLGQRRTIAGIEHALVGMKAGGYRNGRIGPHLAYRDKGIPDLTPADAVLVMELWMRAISFLEPNRSNC